MRFSSIRIKSFRAEIQMNVLTDEKCMYSVNVFSYSAMVPIILANPFKPLISPDYVVAALNFSVIMRNIIF